MFTKPLKDEWYITYPFGKWYKWGRHKGVDLRVKNEEYPDGVGMPVYCTANGEYVKAGFGKREGFYVKIKHSDGFESLYMHLDSYTYKAGWKHVKKGDIIGYAGNTGSQSTGPHLHFEIRKDGVAVDPIPLLEEEQDDKDDKRNQMEVIISQLEVRNNEDKILINELKKLL